MASDPQTRARSFDVVIPMRNGAATIRRTLDSVFAQTLAPKRIIVVDDGSTDGGVELIRHLPQVEVIVTPPKGVSHARNTGIKAASADYVAFLDSDDLWLPEKLQRQMNVFESSPEIMAVVTGYVHTDVAGEPIAGTRHMPRLRGHVFRKTLQLAFRNGSWSSSLAAHRAVLLQTGGYDEHINYCEDIDMWLRLSHAGAVDYCPAVLVHVVENPDSVTRRVRNDRSSSEMLMQFLAVMEKWADAPDLPANFTAICAREILVGAVRNRMSLPALMAFRVQMEKRVPRITARMARGDAVFLANIMLSGLSGGPVIFARLMRFLRLRRIRRRHAGGPADVPARENAIQNAARDGRTFARLSDGRLGRVMAGADRQARHAWRSYLQRYRGFRRNLSVSIFYLTIQSMLYASLAYFIKVIFDDIVQKKPFAALFPPCAEILLVMLVSGILLRTARQRTLQVTKIVIAAMRRELLAKSYALSNFFFATSDRTALHSLIVHDTERVDVMTNAIVVLALPSVLAAIVLAAALLLIAPLLFAVTCVMASASLVVNRYRGRHLKDWVAKFNVSFEAFSQDVLAMLRRMELTRAMGVEALEAAQSSGKIDNLRRVSGSMALAGTTYSVIQTWVTSLVTLTALLVGGGEVISGRMTLSVLAAAYVIINQLGNMLNTIWGAVPQILAGHKSLIDIDRALARTDTVPQGGAEMLPLEGRIELRAIQFSYDDKPLLTDVNLRVAPGEAVVIMGPNGAGKSTLALLLLGIYQAKSGSILLDGRPIEDLSLTHMRRQLGVVLRDPYLFAGSVAENISYGRPDMDMSHIRAVAKLTGADRFIQALPDGYETVIGAGGTSLSGGQSQLIAVSRAILAKPKILILDEPTNHLDHETVTALCAVLRHLAFRPTILLITHDAEFAHGFDRLYRLQGGRLVQASPAQAPRSSMPA